MVETIQDLARYVLCQLFTVLDDWLSKASPEERERVAEQIAEALDGLGADVQEEVRRVAGLDDLSMETLVRAGSLAALATALAAATGVGGFAVYAMLSATIASAAGIIGLTLPFSVYLTATSLLALPANPLVVSVAIVGGGACLDEVGKSKNAGRTCPPPGRVRCHEIGRCRGTWPVSGLGRALG